MHLTELLGKWRWLLPGLCSCIHGTSVTTFIVAQVKADRNPQDTISYHKIDPPCLLLCYTGLQPLKGYAGDRYRAGQAPPCNYTRAWQAGSSVYSRGDPSRSPCHNPRFVAFPHKDETQYGS